MLSAIENRNDVSLLVHTFYQKIRKDSLLGPIFNQMIPNEAWPAHLNKLTDFWETNLFGIPKFKGKPTQKHLETDRLFKYQISQNHFNQWLFLWGATVDELFTGDRATRAKAAAHQIAVAQKMILDKSKPITNQ